MLLKIMSGEDAPDSDERKCFKIMDHVSFVSFERDPDGNPEASVAFTDISRPYERFTPRGNCYLLNACGDTVASFGIALIQGQSRTCGL